MHTSQSHSTEPILTHMLAMIDGFLSVPYCAINIIYSNDIYQVMHAYKDLHHLIIGDNVRNVVLTL